MSATLTRRRLRERAFSRIGSVDRDAGVIHDVRIIGPSSRNGRRYTAEALRGAVGLYEGVKVYVNHPKPDAIGEDRSFRDWAGVLRNVRFEGGAVRGDLHLRREGGSFAEIVEAAEGFPNSFGLSHVADGDSRFDGGIEVVESIKKVFSVDLVMDPATNAGLFESSGYDPDLDVMADGLMSERCARVLATLARLAIEHPKFGISDSDLEQAAENVGLAKQIEAAPAYRESRGGATTLLDGDLPELSYQEAYGRRPYDPDAARRFANRLR